MHQGRRAPDRHEPAARTHAAPVGVFSIAGTTTGGEKLTGSLDEVRVWTVTRTAAQIAQSYMVSLSVPQHGLADY
jgi:hypothetical protein